MEETIEPGEKLISEFNEAKFQIIRLHNIWVELRNSRESGNLVKAKDILDSAQIELSTDANRLDKNIKEDKDKYSKRLNDLTDDIITALSNQKKVDAYRKIKEKEILLRILQQEAGKGGRLREEEEDWM